jgi:hypothetical protein
MAVSFRFSSPIVMKLEGEVNMKSPFLGDMEPRHSKIGADVSRQHCSLISEERRAAKT